MDAFIFLKCMHLLFFLRTFYTLHVCFIQCTCALFLFQVPVLLQHTRMHVLEITHRFYKLPVCFTPILHTQFINTRVQL